MSKHKISMLELERQTGIPANRMYKWYQQGTNPKKEDADKLEEWLNNLDKDTNHTPSVSEPEEKYVANQTIETLRMLATSNQTLCDANKGLADANKRLADAHYLLAEGNRELVRMVEGRASTEGAEQQNQSDAAAIRSVILELLLEYGSGATHWQTVEEGRAIYRKRIADALDLTKREGIQNNSDKQRI